MSTSTKMETTLVQLSVEDLAAKFEQLKFPKTAVRLSELFKIDAPKAIRLFRSLDEAAIVEKITACKYPAFLHATASLIGIDNQHLKQLLRALPPDFLFQKERLKNVYEFNSLLYIFYNCEMQEEAKELIAFANEDLYNYLKVSDIRTLASFLKLLSNYQNINASLAEHGRRFFNKIKFYVPKTSRDKRLNPIPALLKVVSENDMELALKLLKHVQFLVINKEVNWEGEQSFENILAICYYQMGVAFAELKRPDYRQSDIHLTKAIQLLKEEQTDNQNLYLSYFQKAKNALAQKDELEAQLLAMQARHYALQSNLVAESEEITAFMKGL